MALLNVDLSDVQPNEARNFEPVAPGWYSALITGSDMKPTRTGTGHYLELEFTIQDWADEGPMPDGFSNRKVWARLNLDNPSAKAVEIAYGDLRAITDALGLPAKVRDSLELHGKPLDILVTLRPGREEGDNKYAPTNEVKGYRACAGALKPPTASPKPQAAASAAPAAGAPTPPWAMGKK